MGRTSKNIKLRIPEKPHKIKGFRLGSYRVATTISSQSHYDHFDTSPYNVFILQRLLIKIKGVGKRKRNISGLKQICSADSEEKGKR